MINGILFYQSFIDHPEQLLSSILTNTIWVERMKSRKTASFGKAYNYSQISYPSQKMPKHLDVICQQIASTIGFKPNNCLINLYPNGQSKMGYHSDQIDNLQDNTGIAILSLGTERILRYRNIEDKTQKVDYALPAGALIYMNQAVQKAWQHAIPKASTEEIRVSLTFRLIK